jgi:hypothetical protein
MLESGTGWRWVFWVMMIFSGIMAVLTIFLVPETYAPVILYKKVGLRHPLPVLVFSLTNQTPPQVKALRKADPVENKNLFAAYEKQDWSIGGVINRTLFRPFHMLFVEPTLFLITIYISVVYGVLYARASALSTSVLK